VIYGLHSYLVALRISKDDPPFYSLIAAAMLKADTHNTAKLRMAWPELWAEVQRRYNARGGELPEDKA
jgi:hypothetical protein